MAGEDAEGFEHLVAKGFAAPHGDDAEEPSFVDERMSRKRAQPLDARPVGIGQAGLGLQIVGGDHAAVGGDASDGEIAHRDPGENPIEGTETAVLDQVEALLARLAAVGELASPALVARTDQPDPGGSGAEGAGERVGHRGEDALALEGAGDALGHLHRRAQRADRRLQSGLFPLEVVHRRLGRQDGQPPPHRFLVDGRAGGHGVPTRPFTSASKSLGSKGLVR